jgi:hypothetical protein
MLNTNEKAMNYERYYLLTDLNEEMLCHAKETFENYRAQGIVIKGNFEDSEWVLTNQYKKATLRFLPNEFLFKRHAEKWLECSYRSFVEAVKVYAVFNLDGFTVRGIQGRVVNCLVKAAETPYEELAADKHLLEFLKLLPGGETKDRIVEDMEEQLMFAVEKHSDRKQRILSDFTAYFEFNSALESYWADAKKRDKLFYFPLYFWWNLTAILPLRPTEFLLTPRECLETKNGEAILTIRRTTLKARKMRVKHNINEDYEMVKYSIPEKLANEVRAYLKATAKMPLSSLNTLFVPLAHYSCLGRDVAPSSVYYSNRNLEYCLRKFQDKVMKIASEKERIRLGDTRHLAMISLIISGGSPVICKELAGHEDVNISSHYYSNISRFVECATYEMYKKSSAGITATIQNHRLPSIGTTVAVNGGRCDSPEYNSGRIGDCISSMGPNGELGCCISCPHFIDGKTGKYILFSDSKISAQKKQVDEDSKYLIRMLEAVRLGRGKSEDIQSALLRLQHSSSRYGHSLYKNMGGL